jgi:hypothetical protein
VNQYSPHQIKTPKWQPLPAREVVELAMPPGSTFRCMATALEVKTDANTFGTELRAWLLSRSILCSSDGFRSWTQYPHRVRLSTDGARTVDFQSDGLLRERASDGTVRNTLVVMRSDAEPREASPGPPRILPGVEVASD